MRWNVLGERTLYASEWVHLKLVEVEPPGHAPFEHHVVHLPKDAVGVVITDPERGVLLLWRHRFITDSWGWEFPAGSVEPGEDVAAAARREVLEETGWAPGPLQFLFSYNVANGITDHRFHVYQAEGAVEVGPPTDDIEAERIEWVPFAEVPRLIAAGEIPDGPTLVALLYALGWSPTLPT